MLYRTYRPQTFEQVIGQEHVVRTLRGALSGGRIGHAFLFAGPRGTGKTTLARILAKALNCSSRGKNGDPCGKCSACVAVAEGRSLSLIEIDAASNRGIEEMRGVKESAGVSALGGGYKVFLIDEAHMLTKDAANAFLKILEEPPAHVVFILATTEAHKMLPTVLSRVQRFDFRKLTHRQIFTKLKHIAGQEGINVDDDALYAISASSDGALRDAEVSFSKVLATAVRGKEITVDIAGEILGLIPHAYHPEFLGYLVANDRQSAIGFIQRIYTAGIDPEHFSREFLEYLRKVLLTRVDPAILAATGQDLVGEHGKIIAQYAQRIEPEKLVGMIRTFSGIRAEFKSSSLPQLPLELAVMELTG